MSNQTLIGVGIAQGIGVGTPVAKQVVDQNDEAAIEQAIRNWVKNATGLPESAIIFGSQDAPTPAPGVRGAITISLGTISEIGLEWRTESVDNVQRVVNTQAVGTHRVSVTIKAFTKNPLGNASARTLLKQVSLAAGLDSVLTALNEAGLGLLDYSDILTANKVQGAKWESQAVFEAFFCVLQTAAETIPYIAHVNGEGTVHSPGGPDVDVPFAVDLS